MIYWFFFKFISWGSRRRIYLGIKKIQLHKKNRQSTRRVYRDTHVWAIKRNDIVKIMTSFLKRRRAVSYSYIIWRFNLFICALSKRCKHDVVYYYLKKEIETHVWPFITPFMFCLRQGRVQNIYWHIYSCVANKVPKWWGHITNLFATTLMTKQCLTLQSLSETFALPFNKKNWRGNIKSLSSHQSISVEGMTKQMSRTADNEFATCFFFLRLIDEKLQLLPVSLCSRITENRIETGAAAHNSI